VDWCRITKELLAFFSDASLYKANEHHQFTKQIAHDFLWSLLGPPQPAEAPAQLERMRELLAHVQNDAVREKAAGVIRELANDKHPEVSDPAIVLYENTFPGREWRYKSSAPKVQPQPAPIGEVKVEHIPERPIQKHDDPAAEAERRKQAIEYSERRDHRDLMASFTAIRAANGDSILLTPFDSEILRKLFAAGADAISRCRSHNGMKCECLSSWVTTYRSYQNCEDYSSSQVAAAVPAVWTALERYAKECANGRN